MTEKEQYYAEMREKYDVHPDVLNYDDIAAMVPKLKGHKKLVNWLLRWLQVDEVNAVHGLSLIKISAPTRQEAKT